MIKTLLSSKPTCWFLFLAVGWASFCRVWAAVWLKNLFLQIGGVVAVALTAVNDQRAVCFQSVTNAAVSGSASLLAEGCSSLRVRCATDPLFSCVQCCPPCSWQSGEANDVSGSRGDAWPSAQVS